MKFSKVFKFLGIAYVIETSQLNLMTCLFSVWFQNGNRSNSGIDTIQYLK